MPPHPSSTQPRSCAALLSAESETARAMSQFTHRPLSPVTTPALPNWCTPPQPSRVTPDTLARVAPVVKAIPRAIDQFGQYAKLVFDGGIGLLPTPNSCNPPQPSSTSP